MQDIQFGVLSRHLTWTPLFVSATWMQRDVCGPGLIEGVEGWSGTAMQGCESSRGQSVQRLGGTLSWRNTVFVSSRCWSPDFCV